jgi:rubredoxin
MKLNDLAKSEYGVDFKDLPADIKTNIRKAVYGSRVFEFKCSLCGHSFKRRNGGDMRDIYAELEEPIEGICENCKDGHRG